MGRGLDWKTYSSKNASGKRSLLSTSEIEASIAHHFPRGDWGIDPWEIGLEAGFFAETFGARAPLDWTAHQFFYDCARPHELAKGVIQLRLTGKVPVDYSFFREMDDGIGTAIIEWWLATSTFKRKYDRLERRRNRLRAKNIGDRQVEAAIDAHAVEIGL